MIMDTNRIVRQAVRAALWTGGAFIAAQSMAQAQTAPTRVAAADEDSTPALSEVVVTGSRIATPNLDSISPVTAVTSEEIKQTGVTRIEDLINSLPQVVADQGSGISMGSNGTATINLRGLGAQRTLVLINGRRLQGGDPRRELRREPGVRLGGRHQPGSRRPGRACRRADGWRLLDLRRGRRRRRRELRDE